MDLVPFIYFEKQEPGSMLCAQHALNNLMQSPLWTSENLAEIARKLDSLEDSHLDQNDLISTARRRGRSSANYDDSGFFSVQVIDDALNQLGLRLLRWRSEEMKPLHDYPENQEAFILNHDLHWFTLRRFGKNSDRWYNLNSMAQDSPRWIGPNFLSMTISQAEDEGYSIFTVVPVLPSDDPSSPQPGSLIDCEADERAFSMMMMVPIQSGSSSGSSSSTANRRPRDEIEGEEQEIGIPTKTRRRRSGGGSSSSNNNEPEVDDRNLNRSNAQAEDRVVVNDLSYEEQLRMAIEASLENRSGSEPEKNLEGRSDSDDQKGSGKGRSSDPADRDRFKINGSNSIDQEPSIRSNYQLIETDEDADLAAAISASLSNNNTNGNDDDDDLNLTKDKSESIKRIISSSSSGSHNKGDSGENSNNNSNNQQKELYDDLDEPSPEELRQRRLARFT